MKNIQNNIEDINVLNKAFELACEEAADHQCPLEFDLAEWEKCKSCPKNNELHYDVERDIACWKQYYLEKAQKEIML